MTVETRGNVVAFGPVARRGESSGRRSWTLRPEDSRARRSIRGSPKRTGQGAGLLLAGDLSRIHAGQTGNMRYFLAEQKEVNNQMETRASVGFDGQRTGMAAWLADPAPMGSLDYVSPEATFVTSFVVKSPVAIVDELLGTYRRSAMPRRRRLLPRSSRPASTFATILQPAWVASSRSRSTASLSRCPPGSW